MASIVSAESIKRLHTQNILWPEYIDDKRIVMIPIDISTGMLWHRQNIAEAPIGSDTKTCLINSKVSSTEPRMTPKWLRYWSNRPQNTWPSPQTNTAHVKPFIVTPTAPSSDQNQLSHSSHTSAILIYDSFTALCSVFGSDNWNYHRL